MFTGDFSRNMYNNNRYEVCSMFHTILLTLEEDCSSRVSILLSIQQKTLAGPL